MNEKQFLVSVADVVAKNITTKDILFVGKTIINDSIKQSVSSKEINGGFGNALQYEFNYNKQLALSIEDCKFEPVFVALNNGVNIEAELRDFYSNNERVILTNGSGTLAQTPVGKIYIELPDGTNQVISAIGKNITVGTVTGEALCTYQYNTSVDTISIDADKYAGAIEITLIAKVFNKKGLSKEINILVPEFKISGNMDLDFTSEGVMSSKLEGKALADNKNNYAKIMMKAVNENIVPVIQIASTDVEIALSSGETKQLEIIGIRGGVYGNVKVDASDLTFTSSVPATASVSASGLVTWAAAGDAIITVVLKSNATVKDIINVSCS